MANTNALFAAAIMNTKSEESAQLPNDANQPANTNTKTLQQRQRLAAEKQTADACAAAASAASTALTGLNNAANALGYVHWILPGGLSILFGGNVSFSTKTYRDGTTHTTITNVGIGPSLSQVQSGRVGKPKRNRGFFKKAKAAIKELEGPKEEPRVVELVDEDENDTKPKPGSSVQVEKLNDTSVPATATGGEDLINLTDDDDITMMGGK
ncbi:MAG: hypothetical protein Q9218_007510 [Villophora microphyllina]